MVWIHKPENFAHFYVWSLENLRRGYGTSITQTKSRHLDDSKLETPRVGNSVAKHSFGTVYGYSQIYGVENLPLNFLPPMH